MNAIQLLSKRIVEASRRTALRPGGAGTGFGVRRIPRPVLQRRRGR